MSSARLTVTDVSRRQGAADWPRARGAGAAFAFARAACGATEADPEFAAVCEAKGVGDPNLTDAGRVLTIP